MINAEESKIRKQECNAHQNNLDPGILKLCCVWITQSR